MLLLSRHIQVQLRPQEQHRLMLYRCSSGHCGVDTSRCCTSLFSVDSSRQLRLLWRRHVQTSIGSNCPDTSKVQPRPCSVYKFRSRKGSCSPDTSRCSSGPCGVDTSGCSTGLCSVDPYRCAMFLDFLY